MSEKITHTQAELLARAYLLLDSVAYVKEPGDGFQLIAEIGRELERCGYMQYVEKYAAKCAKKRDGAA